MIPKTVKTTVKTGTFEVHYQIVEHNFKDKRVYEWHTSGGAESFEWFDTAEDAERDVRNQL